jgi:O-antigen ligase
MPLKTPLEPLYNQSTGLRLEFLVNSMKLIKGSPIIGYGTGSFRCKYNINYPLYDNINQQIQVNNPNNQYILTLVELDALGLLALLIMFVIMLYESSFLPNREKYIMQGVIFSIIVGCMVNSWLMDFTSTYFFVYFSGVLLGALPKNVLNQGTTETKLKGPAFLSVPFCKTA